MKQRSLIRIFSFSSLWGNYLSKRILFCSSFNFVVLLWVVNKFKLLYVVQGYTDIKKRSILTSMENFVTVLLEAGSPFYTAS